MAQKTASIFETVYEAQVLRSTQKSASLVGDLEKQQRFQNAINAAWQKRKVSLVSQVSRPRETSRDTSRHVKSSRINELLARIARLKGKLCVDGQYDRAVASQISLLQSQLMYLLLSF